jgi:hypothetical protein
LLQNAFPEYPWQPWGFPAVTKGYWDESWNHKEFMDWIAEELNLSVPEDWYSVPKNQLNSRGAGWLLAGYYSGSMPRFIIIIMFLYVIINSD